MIHDSWWLDYRTVSNYFPINCLAWSPCGSYVKTLVLIEEENSNIYEMKAIIKTEEAL